MSSDDSYDDDSRKSDSDDDDDESEKHGSYSESDEEKHSDNGSGYGSNKSYSEDGNSEDDSSVDEYYDDSYDYEKGNDPDDFNDEGSSSEGSESVGDPRYVVTETFADDNEDAQTKNDEFWWEGRETVIAAILLCWCCLCLIIIGVVLGVVLGGRDKVDTINEIVPVPTERPTFAPQPLPPSKMTQSPTESMQPSITVTISPTIRPTSRPTVSPTASFLPTKSIPEELGIAADQDTYVQYNVSKEYQGEEYGLMDTLLVQNGPIKDEVLPDSVGLITFSLKSVPQFSRMVGRQKSAVLQLTHVVSAEERPLANYTIVRVPETLSAVEYFHGFYFALPEDDDDGVLVGPSFIVNPGDTVINIDISSLLYNYTLDENRKAKQLFLMIENRGPEQIEGGDRFYTRESLTPPQLLLNFVETNDTEVRRF